MRSRRSIIISLIQATGALITAPQLVCRAWAQSVQQAVSFVGSTTDQLVKIVNSPDPPQEKRHSLQQVIDRTVDVNNIGQFCLGRFWRIATPAQRQEYLRLFGDLLVTKIAAHLGEYQGVRVTVGLARAAEDTEIVS
jgi:phospholipid transport system substrate-binding protein